MKTDIIKTDSSGKGLRQALDHIEGLANVMEMTDKESLQLRLLAEEVFVLVRSIAGEFTADFWAEAERRTFRIILEADSMSPGEEQKEELIALARNGTNADDAGIMSKVGRVFEYYLRGLEAYHINNSLKAITNGQTDESWSLSKYKKSVTGEAHIDELERSIVANIADDIIVSVRDKRVKLEIFKRFA